MSAVFLPYSVTLVAFDICLRTYPNLNAKSAEYNLLPAGRRRARKGLHKTKTSL